MVLMEVVAHSTATADQVKTIARQIGGVKAAATASRQAPQPLTIGAGPPRSQRRSQPHCLDGMADVAQSSTILLAILRGSMEHAVPSMGIADQVKTIARQTKGVNVVATARHPAPQLLTILVGLPRNQPHHPETMADVAQNSMILHAILKGSTEDVVPSGATADRVQTPALDIKGVRAGAGLLTEAGRLIPPTRHHGTMAAVDGNLMVLSVIQMANMGVAVPNTAIAARRRKVRSIGPMLGFRTRSSTNQRASRL